MRARFVKPGFFDDTKLCRLPAHARLLFIGLWCLADREGRILDIPRRIAADVFPHEDIDAGQVNLWLSELQAMRFIHRYESEDVKAIEIIKFKQHQKVHPDEKASTIPASNENPMRIQLDSSENHIGIVLDSRSTSTSTSTTTSTSTDVVCAREAPPLDDAPERIDRLTSGWPIPIGFDLGKRLIQDLVAQSIDQAHTLATLEANIPPWAKYYAAKPPGKRRRLDNLIRDGDWKYPPPAAEAEAPPMTFSERNESLRNLKFAQKMQQEVILGNIQPK